MMATQQAGVGGIIQGGYDSDVEGGNTNNDNAAGFESFSDKAVSHLGKCNIRIIRNSNMLCFYSSTLLNAAKYYTRVLFCRSAEVSFGRFMEY